MQYTSLNIQMNFTLMLPDLTEHIRPTIQVLHLLLNFIFDKCANNFLKRKALNAAACMCEAGSSLQIFSQAFMFATQVFKMSQKNLTAANEIVKNSTR